MRIVLSMLCKAESRLLTSGSSQYRRLPRPSKAKGGLISAAALQATTEVSAQARPVAAVCRGPTGPTCAA